MVSTTSAETKQVRAEVERLHAIIEALLSRHAADDVPPDDTLAAFVRSHSPAFTLTDPGGRTLRWNEVRAMIEAARGAAPGLRITIEDVRVVVTASEHVVATYREVHERPEGDTLTRAATAVFERDADAVHGLRWRHLHETWVDRDGDAPAA